MKHKKLKMSASLRRHSNKRERVLTISSYESARSLIDAEAKDIIQTFGSWDSALEKAGLINNTSLEKVTRVSTGKIHLKANERLDLIGKMKIRMKELNMSMDDLASLLRENTGKNFPKSAVSAILRNRKGITYEVSDSINEALGLK